MRTDRIVVVGILTFPEWIRRQRHCRNVIHPSGISVCINAGCGMGGGITPKVLVLYED